MGFLFNYIAIFIRMLYRIVNFGETKDTQNIESKFLCKIRNST